MRINQIAFFLAVCSFGSSLAAQEKPARPRITGIAGVEISSVDSAKSRDFYSKILESDVPCVWCGDTPMSVFYAFNEQYLLVYPHLKTNPETFLREITFRTDSVPALRKLLQHYNVRVSDSPPKDVPDDHLVAIDPEGHRVGFTDRQIPSSRKIDGRPLMRIIHAGFVVKSRALEDSFYQDILGFHVYWRGGMKDSDTDWVDMQVPDGTDWLEYMLNVSETADQKELGIMNHIAIGIPDIESGSYRIQKNGLTSPEQPQIGRDGKWQLNFYDPDDTRVELMEFTPTQKPCCHPYTASHPKP